MPTGTAFASRHKAARAALGRVRVLASDRDGHRGRRLPQFMGKPTLMTRVSRHGNGTDVVYQDVETRLPRRLCHESRISTRDVAGAFLEKLELSPPQTAIACVAQPRPHIGCSASNQHGASVRRVIVSLLDRYRVVVIDAVTHFKGLSASVSVRGCVMPQGFCGQHSISLLYPHGN